MKYIKYRTEIKKYRKTHISRTFSNIKVFCGDVLIGTASTATLKTL